MTNPKSHLLQELEANPRWLVSLSTRLLGSAEGAEDLAQDAAALALREPSVTAPAGRGQARAWLATTVKHLARNARRRRGTEGYARRGLDPERLESAELSPVDLLAKAEYRSRVAALVLELPEGERKAILLRFYEGKKGAEIQAALGAPSQAAVRQRVTRGISRLRQRLEAEGDEQEWRHAALLTVGASSTAPGTLKVGAAALGLALLGGGLASAWWISSKEAPSAAAQNEVIAAFVETTNEAAPTSPTVELVQSAAGADRQSVVVDVKPPAAPAAQGLRIRVLDKASGEPISDLAWFLIPTGKLDYGREWGLGPQEANPKALASGVTDEEGYVIAPLPEYELVNLCTDRNESYARGSWPVSISNGESEIASVTLGPGSTVTGRVVDDKGGPVEGVQVYSRTYLDERIPFGTTDADGRYSIPRCADFPRSFVVREDGEVEPTRTLATEIGFARAGAPSEGAPNMYAAGHADVLVGEALTAAAPDVVLPRLLSISGRVVDETGQGIEGALVALSSEHGFAAEGSGKSPVHDARPWNHAGFTPSEGQSVTDKSGRYELTTPSPRHGRTSTWVAAYSIGGAVGIQEVPDVVPGASLEGVDFELNDEGTVRIYLVPPSGAGEQTELDALSVTEAKLLWDLPDGRGQNSPSSGTSLTLAFAATPEVVSEGEQTWVLIPKSHQPDRTSRNGVLSGALFLDGYRSAQFALPRDVMETNVTLQPLRRVKLRLQVKGAAAKWLQQANVTVTPEAPDPALSIERQVRRYGHSTPLRSKVYGWKNGEERSVAVRGDRPVYAYVELFSAGRGARSLAAFGPIPLDGNPLGDGLGDAFVLMETVDEWPERGQEGKGTEGDSSPNLNERRSSKVLARIVSDADGEFLDGAKAESVTEGVPGRWSYQRRWKGEERPVELNLTTETVTLKLHHVGHYPKEVGPFTLSPGVTTDLGDIRMDPLQKIPCRLETQDGSPSGPGFLVERRDPEAGWAQLRPDAEGRFDLFVGSAGPSALRIRHKAGSNDPACVAHPELLPDGTARVVIPEWRPVHVRITGLPAPYCYGLQQLKLVRNADTGDENPVATVYNFPQLDGSDLIFDCKLPPGRWTVVPARPSFASFPETAVLVEPADPNGTADGEPIEVAIRASLTK